jgi:hypothetical protein
MSDLRVKYIQERLEQGLTGWDYTPSVDSLLATQRARQMLDEFFKPEGPSKMLFYCQVSYTIPVLRCIA